MKSLLSKQDSEVQVWPAYTDVVMNIVLILLMYLFIQIIQSAPDLFCQLEIRKGQSQMKEIVEQTVRPESRRDVTIITDGNLQRFTFADHILFDSGRADLKESGKALLNSIGKIFHDQTGSFSQIQIEGHTDDRPIRGLFNSNWELSSARATSVVQFLQSSSGLEPGLLSATGYSEYHPVDLNSTEEGRAHNRRIEIVLVYSTQKICKVPDKAESKPSSQTTDSD